ncbi:MAG: hypothetical protein CME25_21780 [Gemmatimonadetes bacterium]|nr:hypothetical protein [Gemmatimonadota bacterium]
MSEQISVEIRVREPAGIARRNLPVTQGVPLPEGVVTDAESIVLLDEEGHRISSQLRVMSRWPDGSLKWILVDFQADLEADGEAAFRLMVGEPGYCAEGSGIKVVEADTHFSVCTGPMRLRVSRMRFGLVEKVELGHRDDEGRFVCEELVTGDRAGDAWVRTSESSQNDDGDRFIYGMGGDCLASLDSSLRVEVEEHGPLRIVIRCVGGFEADIPMHHYSGYQPFRFITRIYAYAGKADIRVLHTVVVACNPAQTQIEEIGLRIPMELAGRAKYQVSGERPFSEFLGDGSSVLLSQGKYNHFRLLERRGEQVRGLGEGEKTEGWMALEDDRVGVGVGLRYMAEEYPKAIGTSVSKDGLIVYPWKDPDGGRLSFSRYDQRVAWDEGEGVYSDGLGTSKTTEFFFTYYRSRAAAAVPDRLRGLLNAPVASVDPAWNARCDVTGGFAVSDPDRFPLSERMMTGFLDWMERSIVQGGWYGFFDWGDLLVSWDEETNDWRFHGRWGWCNSEWDPRHGVWIQYLRTGDDRYFRLGEAMTRHSVDVDTCHYQPLRPYQVGGCFRHSVDHFGDEPCASHTFLDNWVDYYYLSGDLRTLEVIREAGDFFLRYRWTEDPAYSFSLRCIANTLRGLLYCYEVTGEERFRVRADEVYGVIARGQNEDGSWHKRFQVSTPDRLSDQAPYGMATEGTTLAVEMGTAGSFTDGEFRKLRGQGKSLIRVVPPSDQKGYQTHYLMVGLDLLHRMTGRRDVAEVYRRAVDWFCGSAQDMNAEHAISQRYGGIVCRHLGYAYRLTGNKAYLEIGRSVLDRLMQDQNWSEDLRRRGAVGLSPMFVSLLFFGVPYFLGVLEEAELEERP